MVPFTYTSNFYYDVVKQNTEEEDGWTFVLQKTPFNKPFIKSIQEKVFEPYKENAEYYVALNDLDEEIGLLVIGHTKWNNLLRIWDCYIAISAQRQRLGTQLLQFAEAKAKKLYARGIILECQSSNYPAIQFYRNYGFDLIGFDLICYSNTDVEKHEVRLEMAKLFNF
jgi:ribosomal protein S18 acetylase RimI-like enzyme